MAIALKNKSFVQNLNMFIFFDDSLYVFCLFLFYTYILRRVR